MSTSNLTARRAGMAAVGAAWGFRPVEELCNSGAECVLSSPVDLLDLVQD